jgi:hypothetical protein
MMREFATQRALPDRFLERGKLLLDRRPVQRAGRQLSDPLRVQVQSLARFYRYFSSLRLRGVQAAPWPTAYASHTGNRIGSAAHDVAADPSATETLNKINLKIPGTGLLLSKNVRTGTAMRIAPLSPSARAFSRESLLAHVTQNPVDGGGDDRFRLWKNSVDSDR